MHQLKIKRLLAAVSLALMPLVIVPQMSFAAGLGKLRVNSGLGEPLSAEIDVLSATSAELDSLEAKLASDSVYESQGIERPSLYNAIRVEVKKKAGGAVLKLSSAEAITEPFLDMLIQMDWGSGQLLREYNLLLDPPGYNKQKNIEAPVVKAPIDKAPKDEPLASKPEELAAVASEDTPKNKKTNKKSAKKLAEIKPQVQKPEAEKPVEPPAPQTSEPAVSNADGYKTKSGDNLSNIAKKSLQDGVNLDQYMVAMFRANQDAFKRQNMNRLKVGQIVKMPSADEAKAIAPLEAKKEIVLHSKDWDGYKNNLADQVAHTAGQESGEPTANQSKGKISAKAEDKSAEATGQRDVVKLSKNDGKGNDGNGKNASQAQLSALQDELAARDNAVNEANTRSAMLEKRISDMQKLLTLKNQSLAEVQKSAAETQAPAKPSEPKKTTEAETQAKPTVEPAKPAETTKPAETKPEQPAVSEPQSSEPQSSEPQSSEPQYSSVVTQPPPQASDEKVASKSTEESSAPSMFDGLLADPMMLGGAVGGLALLGGAWLFIRKKRKRGLDNLEKAIQTSSGLKENTVFGNTEGTSIGSGTTSFLTDFSQSGGGMIDTHDVDPIAEAEVYMAYGRDAQAEEILKDAISKDPKRAELHLKLLELYAGRKDAQGFETVAGELYSNIGVEDPAWEKAALLGRGLEPNNPLYQTADASAVPAGEQVGNTFAETLSEPDFSEPEEIEYSVDSGMAEDAVDSSDMDTHAMDADFAAIEGFGADSDEPNKTSTELEFSLGEDIATSAVDSLANKGEPSHEAEDKKSNSDNSLDFPTFNESGSNQIGLGQTGLDKDEGEEALAGVDETIVLAADPFEASSLKAGDSNVGDNEIDFPDFSGLEMPAVDKSVAAKSSPLTYKPLETDKTSLANPDADQLAVLATKTQNKLEEIDLDLPDLDVSSNVQALGSDLALSSDSTSSAESAATSLDLPSFDLSDIDLAENQKASPTNKTEIASALDNITETPIDALSSPEVDFSKIDLDLGVEPTAPAQATEANSLADEFDMESESSEVETKLDLVTAYIDMGDQEGAKELLEEVLKEGGPQQRIRAQEMLKSLA